MQSAALPGCAPQIFPDGTVNFTFNRSDYRHERCQAVIPWIPISSDHHQSRCLAVSSLMITDKLKSYSAAHREIMPLVTHSTEQYENNRAEVSHEQTRQRERQMRRFKSAGQAQRFLTVYGVVGNLFRLGRHLTRAIHYREFRSRAFCEWQAVTCAQIMA